MTEKDIDLRYDEARVSVNELRQHAAELNACINRYKDTLLRVEASWEGQSSRQFIVRTRDRIRGMERARDRLESLSTAIMRTANAYRQTERARLRNERKKA